MVYWFVVKGSFNIVPISTLESNRCSTSSVKLTRKCQADQLWPEVTKDPHATLGLYDSLFSLCIVPASFSIEDSGEEENAPANNNAASGLTQNHLANVLNSLNQRQQQQQRNQAPGISRDYFQQVMQQVFSQNLGAAAANAGSATEANRPSTSAAQASSSAGEPMDTTQAPAAPQQPRNRLTDTELAAKLDQMHELGLWDDELNVRALQVTEGDVEASVSLILEGVDF